MESKTRPARVRISAVKPHVNLRILTSARNKAIQLREQIWSSNSGERVKSLGDHKPPKGHLLGVKPRALVHL
ncbi:hypothetical protein NDU88_006894 [Pleurodeles waltl]|uniref:Uncharacterized protein n=1 Tax=Pleurodeles waltl TaxID=8319 RepID=A0AAV7VSV4_PLEWA|nr:hypothetical protein NDU88_006894 [Pleurodeles waltl]